MSRALKFRVERKSNILQKIRDDDTGSDIFRKNPSLRCNGLLIFILQP
ncbi:hypothetical protein [Filifactor villosus]|uniref:Uncharacterized protein n=1 Tax=Filifactor villosus TaxID=29374 RepID=A0ABV9QKL3_9FIRM